MCFFEKGLIKEHLAMLRELTPTGYVSKRLVEYQDVNQFLVRSFFCDGLAKLLLGLFMASLLMLSLFQRSPLEIRLQSGLLWLNLKKVAQYFHWHLLGPS